MCRSPMAEGLFKRLVMDEAENWLIGSAGTWASPGLPASSKALTVLREKGFTLDNHLTRSVDKMLLGEFNLILTMEKDQKEALMVEFPEYQGKIYLLSEMIDEEYDIADPVGGDLDAYRDTADEIEKILREGFPRIEQLAQDKHDQRL